MSGLTLHKANFSNSDLSMADFSGCDLTDSIFDNADLSGANFKYSILKNCSFNNADLSNADMSGADLTGADFTNADISICNFTNATISQTTFFNVRNAANVSGKDKHRYYSMPNGAIPDGPAGFRDIVENVIVDISGQNLAINSRGHTGNDGPPEATHPDIDASCYSNFSY